MSVMLGSGSGAGEAAAAWTTSRRGMTCVPNNAGGCTAGCVLAWRRFTCFPVHFTIFAHVSIMLAAEMDAPQCQAVHCCTPIVWLQQHTVRWGQVLTSAADQGIYTHRRFFAVPERLAESLQLDWPVIG